MKTLISILFLIVILLLGAIEVEAQQLREIVKQVDESVVVVKTVEKNLLTSPQTMFVSSPGSGSGVLISTDGKVLTAAHVVQAADKVEVEFVDGQTVPAKVISSIPTADVAMLKLDWVPYNAKPARVGDSDKMQVGDDVFIIGANFLGLITIEIGKYLRRAGEAIGRVETNRCGNIFVAHREYYSLDPAEAVAHDAKLRLIHIRLSTKQRPRELHVSHSRLDVTLCACLSSLLVRRT